jgi:hypothetical protein
MATAFMGYVLPFGQMSFWGATVITNLLSSFPKTFSLIFCRIQRRALQTHTGFQTHRIMMQAYRVLFS